MEHRLTRPACAQRGMAMIFALIVLAAMALAAVALVRSVDTTAQIAGNLSFRQDATANADRVAQEAIAMLYSKLDAGGAGALDADSSGDGYYASVAAAPLLDPTGNLRATENTRQLIKWDDDYCAGFASSSYSSCTLAAKTSTAVLAAGNRGAYIVFRMCDSAGAAGSGGVQCAATGAAVASTCQGMINYENLGRCPSEAGVTPFYRVLVRVVGPRNATSYTETVVHF